MKFTIQQTFSEFNNPVFHSELGWISEAKFSYFNPLGIAVVLKS